MSPATTCSTHACEDSSNSSSNNNVRKGQLCCFCCCDFRRAVIIVDIIIMVFEALLLIMLASGGGQSLKDYGYFVTDETIRVEMIFSGISIVTGALAILGALKYNLLLVLLNFLWLLIGYIAGVAFVVHECSEYNESYNSTYYFSYSYCEINGFTVFLQAVVMILWAYPHGMYK